MALTKSASSKGIGTAAGTSGLALHRSQRKCVSVLISLFLTLFFSGRDITPSATPTGCLPRLLIPAILVSPSCKIPSRYVLRTCLNWFDVFIFFYSSERKAMLPRTPAACLFALLTGSKATRGPLTNGRNSTGLIQGECLIVTMTVVMHWSDNHYTDTTGIERPTSDRCGKTFKQSQLAERRFLKRTMQVIARAWPTRTRATNLFDSPRRASRQHSRSMPPPPETDRLEQGGPGVRGLLSIFAIHRPNRQLKKVCDLRPFHRPIHLFVQVTSPEKFGLSLGVPMQSKVTPRVPSLSFLLATSGPL